MKAMLCLLLLHLGSACGAVSDSLLVADSLPAPSVRVRSVDAMVQIDSLWTDTIWSWSGPCENNSRLFRFEFGDSLYRSVSVPCTAAVGHAIQMTAASLYAEPGSDHAPPQREGDIRLSLNELLKIRSQSIQEGCYPPLPQSEFQLLFDELNAAIFESDKCALLSSRGQQSCLTSHQVKEALLLIPSEDKRLQTMQDAFAKPGFWSREDLESLFQLRYIYEQALESFETF